MKKLIFLLFFLLICAQARALEISDTHIHNSRFWKNSVSISARPAYALFAGAEFDITQHKAFDNDVYAFRLPVSVRMETASLNFRPFFYPDNANGAYAYGGKVSFTSRMNRDEINDYTTYVFLSAALAANKADVVKNGASFERESFYQSAYTLGLNFDFFRQYGFEVSGNVFQYLSGISDVDSVRGVLDQQELADLGTLDYVLGLPRFSTGVKMKWLSNVSRSDNFISYRYIDFHNQGARHSLLLSSTVNFYGNWFVNFSYNHLFGGGNRDLYGASIMVKF